MAASTTAYRDIEPATWLSARRHGVPAAMVERATERRLAGDWRGALAQAHVKLAFNLDVLRDQHAAQTVQALEDDLLHLVPDLLRWHLPRNPEGLLDRSTEVALTQYPDGSALVAHATDIYRGQWISLWLNAGIPWRLRSDDWTEARHLWDVRACGDLPRLAGFGDPLTEEVLRLQDAGDPVAAWELAGVRVDDGFAHPELTTEEWDAVWADHDAGYHRPDERNRDEPAPAGLAALVPRLVPAARAVLGAPDGPPRLALYSRRPGARSVIVLRLEDGELHASRAHESTVVGVPALPCVLWQRNPDVELLRTGQIEPDELHPLVRAALLPDHPDPGYRPRDGYPPDGSTLDEWVSRAVAVPCEGTVHRVGFRDGRLVALNHAADGVRREQALVALGAKATGCLQAIDAWRRNAAWRSNAALPDALAALRSHAATVVAHGDIGGLVRLLDAGIDPGGFVDQRGVGLLHRLSMLLPVTLADGRRLDAAALVPRLVASGLDIDARTGDRRSPLYFALLAGSADLTDALLAAGADPRSVVDGKGYLTGELSRSTLATSLRSRLAEAAKARDP